MRLITFVLFFTFSFHAIGQDCIFLPSDTIVCGFKHDFQIIGGDGTFYYECDDNKNISIGNTINGSTMFSFNMCGEYEIIFESNIDNCLDTFRIEVNDPSNSATQLNTDIGLGYGDIDCPGDVVANCNSDGVSISLPNGTPVPIWEFCTTASCQSTFYTTEVLGNMDGCIIDSIACDTTFFSDSNSECIETNQDAFIILNADGDMVDNNTFLEYLAQLQSSIGIDCPSVFDDCFDSNEESCYDTTVIDTSYLHIPVRIGGKWTIASIDSVELFDTTYFEYLGTDYELILDPGVEYYGPGNLNVFLNEIIITTGNDTIRNFPYGFQFQLLWEEEWIIDTLELIKEIPIDTTGDCFTCGGNFFNSFFNVPGIPEFPCGPVTITYPDQCECESQYPDFSIQLINCLPTKQWQVDILGGDYEIYAADSANIVGGHNTAIISLLGSNNINLYAVDLNGCEYIIPLTIESTAELLQINPHPDELSCENPEIELRAYLYDFYWDSFGTHLEFDNPPIWTLPNGELQSGESIFISEPGSYKAEYSDVYGCIFEDETFILYNDEEFTNYETESICGNETIVYNGQEIDQPGIYTFDIACNETTILTVEQYDVQETEEYYTVCEGEVIDVHGQVLTVGSHYLEIQNGSPCPDIVLVEVVETVLNLSWSVSTNCEGSASLSISHDIDGANYLINNNGVNVGEFTSNGNSFDLQIEDSGSYQVVVEVNGCYEYFVADINLMEYQISPHENGMLTCSNNCVTIEPEIVNLHGNVSASDYTILWEGPDGFSATYQSIEVCQDGNYTMHLQYGDNCIVSQSIFIGEDLQPEVQVIEANLCFGECYDDGTYSFCQTTQSIIDVDDCTRLEVDVRISDEIIAEEFYSLCEGESVIVNETVYDQDGEYSAIFISETGCDSTLNFTVDVLERGEISSENIIDCNHNEALLSYSTLNANETYIWRDFTGSIVSQEVDFLARESGIYSLEIMVIGNEINCSFTEEFELLEQIIIPEIMLDNAYTLNCENSVNLTMSLEEGTTWIWEGGPGQLYIENENLEADLAGVYSVSVTNIEGCTASKFIEIIQVAPIELAYTSNPTCEGMDQGAFVISSISGGIAPYTIMLDEVEVETSVDQLDAGDYVLQILQSDGCVFEQDITIESIADLDDIPIQNLEYCNNNGVTITLNINDAISFAWLDGYESKERQIREEGTYEVELSNGCSSIISTYHVEDTRVEDNFVVSNIFAPNGHLLNRKMKIAPQVAYEDFKLYIFSRDGSLVYETTNPENGWDGKIGGNSVIIGSYVWMIESNIYSCSGEIEKTQDVGTVMVIY